MYNRHNRVIEGRLFLLLCDQFDTAFLDVFARVAVTIRWLASLPDFGILMHSFSVRLYTIFLD